MVIAREPTISHLWLSTGTAILIIRLGLIGVQGKAVLIISGAHRAGEGTCNSVYCQRRRKNSNVVDFLLCLVSTVTIFSSTILLWLKKAAMFEFCHMRRFLWPLLVRTLSQVYYIWHEQLCCVRKSCFLYGVT